MTNGISTVYLLRHAETQPDPDIPEPDWALSSRGRQQALDLIPVLEELGVDVITSSPYLRAINTVRPFADRLGLEVTVHPDLRERKLIEGMAPDFRALLRKTWEDFQFAAPGGESSAACQARVRRAINELTTRNQGLTLLLASHGNAIGLYLNSIDGSFGFDDWSRMKNPDLFKVAVSTGQHFWDRSWRHVPEE